jgi:16S rRNA (guanine527-N7)-methyltransferase
MIGAAPIADVIDHSAAFLAALDHVRGTVIDLGSGGGVPGLVVAWMRPDLSVVLVDRRATRTDHLRRLVHRLNRAEQVAVVTSEAAALPHLLAGPAAAVVARSFGPPAAVLRVATPILADDGVIVVSEPPPDARDRWPAELLERYGVVRRDSDRRIVVLRRIECSP